MPATPQTGRFFFASESVAEGHPDKLCDRVADAILDACLAQDSESRVACEACTKSGMVMVLGELVTKASVNFEQVVREAVKALGFDGDEKGLDWRTMNIISAVEEQSPDLADLAQALAVGKAPEAADVGALGVAHGYATDESPELMPLSHLLAARICAKLDATRRAGGLTWARPGGRAQVTLEYEARPDGALRPTRVCSVALAVPGNTSVESASAERELMEQVVQPVLPVELCDATTQYRITKPLRGAHDAGLSGRQQATDLYGGWAPVGPPISGQDGTRLGRAAVYGARWAARSLVAAGHCKRCLVQLGYSPGEAQPTSVHVQSYGSAAACGKTDAELVAAVLRNFDLRLSCLQRDLGLKTFQFEGLAAHGHLGRADLDLAWERSKELH